MNVSDKCISLIKQYEGLELTAKPCPAGIPTVGYGHIRGVKNGFKITLEQAEKYLQEDLKSVILDLTKALNDAEIEVTQGQFDALASLVFNLGITKFLNSTLWKKLCAGDKQGAAEQFLVWCKARNPKFDPSKKESEDNPKKITLKGLLERRKAERELFLS